MRIEAMELKHTDGKISELADRLSVVENSPARTPGEVAGSESGFKHIASDGWIADHVVVGGWRPEAGNPEKVEAMEAILNNMPSDIKGRHLKPFAPRKDSCPVLKVRFESVALVARASFAIAQRLQAVPPPDALLEMGKRWWAATERHPTLALRRRNLLAAAGDLRQRWPDIKCFASMTDGVIWLDNMRVLKSNHEGNISTEAGWFEHPATKNETWPLARRSA